MKQLKLTLILVIAGLLLSAASAQPHRLRLALDWVPNTNHTGIYVALAKGWYAEEGLELQIFPFAGVAPAVLVAAGQADVGIGGTQRVLGAAAVGEPVVAIAAIISTNTAALAVLETSDIMSPKDLDGRLYAAFGGPIERPIIEAVIRHAGGEGAFESVILGVGGFDALLAGRVDFIWLYEGWQGVQAKREGTPLRFFNFTDFGIADHYNPVFLASPQGIEQNAEALRAFLRATARGYEFAADHPEEAARLLIETAPPGSIVDSGLVYDSQAFVSQFYRKPGLPWGVMDHQNWQGFTQFLLEVGVLTDADGRVVSSLEIDALYTNELLPD